MISKDEKKKSLAKLSEPEEQAVKSVIRDLEYLLDHHTTITFKGNQYLNGIENSLSIISQNYTDRLINLMRKGYELD